MFAKRRKRAEKWVVDETSIGQNKPSAFADQFIQDQLSQQQLFKEKQQLEQVYIYVGAAFQGAAAVRTSIYLCRSSFSRSSNS